MTETRTTRFGLPQWSVGSDSPSRADFNEAFANVEARAAYDDGTTAGSLPGSGLVAGRYFRQNLSDGYALHRRSASAWEWVGGSVAQTRLRYRTANDAAMAWSVDQGSDASAKLIAYGSGALASAAEMRAMTGAFGADLDAVLSASTTGRAYVRTRANGELGLVVAAHGAGAGNLFAARDAGGSDITVIDALGRLRQSSISAFGGAVLGTTAAATVAPTAADADGIVTGLLAHGQTGGAGREAKSILQLRRDLADTAPIANVLRDQITLGRLPWGSSAGHATSGTIVSAGNRHTWRASGAATTYARWTRSDVSSPANELDTALDTALLTLASAGITTRLPIGVTQREAFSSPALLLERVGDFSANFLTINRRTAGAETVQSMAYMDPSGRMATGSPWRGTGTTRDSRQPVLHRSRKVYAGPGDPVTAGQAVAIGATHTYEWPTMRTRSTGTTDLEIRLAAELMFGQLLPNGPVSGAVYAVKLAISIGGAAYVDIENQENAGASTQGGMRASGDLIEVRSSRTAVASDTDFKLRLQFVNGSSSAIPIYIRSLELIAREVVFENYTES